MKFLWKFLGWLVMMWYEWVVKGSVFGLLGVCFCCGVLSGLNSSFCGIFCIYFSVLWLLLMCRCR